MNQRAGLVAGLIVLALTGCDALLTEAPDGADALDGPLPGITDAQFRMFLAGDEAFEQPFTPQTGLGPVFNHVSCAGCHPGDGRGTPDEILVRFSRGDDLLLDQGGPQQQDKAIPGAEPEEIPEGAATSPRLPPPVFGRGLIEAIPQETILAGADPDDEDGDGISGRPNLLRAPSWVPAAEVGGGSGLHVGRFGLKANIASLLHQVAGAYQQDMGITSDFLPEEPGAYQAGGQGVGDMAPDPELPGQRVRETTMYVRLLAPPAQGERTARVVRGETLFADANCDGCHTPSMRTGPHAIDALVDQDVFLYSDLLLHDMGEGLADFRPDGAATGREWKTPPLWGLRVAADFIGGEVFYLHDGRTTSLDEAIRAHGGESQASTDAYIALPEVDQAALRAFVLSL
jgi:CxxC motif-containing protein (DUF1111 family)